MKILAVSHEASATGAPIFFHTLLSWIKQKTTVCFDIIVVKPGLIRNQFEELGRSLFLSDYSESEQDEELNTFLSGARYDVVYLNTLESAHVLEKLIAFGLIGTKTKIVSHIHELEGTIQKYGAERIQVLNSRADLIICVSEAVKVNLVKNHGFNSSKLRVVNPCSRSLKVTEFLEEDQSWFSSVRDKRVIFGCGEIAVGKGTDTFIRTAVELKRRYLRKQKDIDFVFVWLGPDSYKIRSYFERDIDILKLQDLIKFFGHRDEVYPFFERSDIFFMSSRQDSFPLVCLEAASLGKPILYFPDAGGIGDFLGTERGFPLPYQDFEAAADLLTRILEDERLTKDIGMAAKAGWVEKFSADRVCSTVYNLVLSMSGGFQSP